VALPLIPLIKIIALGSLKVVFLFFGALFFPVLSLRFILSGASGMLLPVLDWLESQGRIDKLRHRAVIDDIEALSAVEFTRTEARRLLFKLIRKTVQNMGMAVITVPATLLRWITRLFNSR